MVPLTYYAVLSAILFGIGIIGFLLRRSIITLFMSIELMLNAVNLAFVTFSQAWHDIDGQIYVFLVIVVAAAEAAIGLAIVILVFRNFGTLNIERISRLGR